MATRSEVRLLPQNTEVNVYLGRDPEEFFANSNIDGCVRKVTRL
jgi:hypothetical protein